MKTNKKTTKFNKFETKKLVVDKSNVVKGGYACTCDTYSLCHIDGAVESDAI